MAQLCVYLDEPTMAKLRSSAESSDISLSKFVAKLVNDERTASAWPEGFWSLLGSLSEEEFPDIEDLPPVSEDEAFDDFAWR